jgi:hypothetical protein
MSSLSRCGGKVRGFQKCFWQCLIPSVEDVETLCIKILLSKSYLKCEMLFTTYTQATNEGNYCGRKTSGTS